MEKLSEYLATLSPGEISDMDKVERVELLLAEAWGQVEGPSGGGMTAHKIHKRLESIGWDPPLLSFTIERHGATMLGSSRANLQDWVVDVDEGTSSYTTRRRQLYKMSPPLKTKPLAEQIGRIIAKRQKSKKLKWSDDKTIVRVIIGKIIPDDTARQTVAGRRKRFRRDLTEFLQEYGWQEVRPNKYRFIS
jgi:hypothetical protein